MGHRSGIGMRPGESPFTERTPRVIAARRLLRRSQRDTERLFLAEGPQAVREAVDAGTAVELFGTPAAFDRYAELTGTAASAGARLSPVTDRALESLAETRSPQGLVAVCRQSDVPLSAVLAAQPRLVAVLADIRDPGNAGTVLRSADAAGADAVVFAGHSVDPYNGKCVRASTGSLFHLPLCRSGDDPVGLVHSLRTAGLRVFAADGGGADDLDDLADAGELAAPTAWLFGSEAHGLPPELAAAADRTVRVPVYGRAESLNLAAAAVVCLYASARCQRRGKEGTDE